MATSTYWAKRILADEKRAQALTSRAARKTQQAYRASYKRVLREMEGLYAQAQSGGAVTRTQLWRYSHWRGMTEELRKFASSGAALEEQRLTKVLDQVFSNVIGADVKAFGQKQWRTRLNASSVVNTAWSGENYSTRIWRNRALLASRVREEVTQAVLDGKPVNRIAADLQSAFSSSWSQAERLARTETSYVFNQASLRRYAELGINKVRWITGINDGRECEVCAERSGQVYDLNNAPMMPAHPNCRCAWGGVVEEEANNTDSRTNSGVPNDIQLSFDRTNDANTFTRAAKRANPLYESGPAYKLNCTHCVAAYEMIRRGFNVVASPAILQTDEIISSSDTIAHSFGYTKIFRYGTLEPVFGDDEKQVRARMKKWGDGSRAIVNITWSNRSSRYGHVFIAEQINGKTYFIDPQNGATDCSSYFTQSRKGATMIMRIDDCEITDEVYNAVESASWQSGDDIDGHGTGSEGQS